MGYCGQGRELPFDDAHTLVAGWGPDPYSILPGAGGLSSWKNVAGNANSRPPSQERKTAVKATADLAGTELPQCGT